MLVKYSRSRVGEESEYGIDLVKEKSGVIPLACETSFAFLMTRRVRLYTIQRACVRKNVFARDTKKSIDELARSLLHSLTGISSLLSISLVFSTSKAASIVTNKRLGRTRCRDTQMTNISATENFQRNCTNFLTYITRLVGGIVFETNRH